MKFRGQISKTMEVYVDDMLVKSKSTNDHVKYLGEMFAILRNYQMKLNPPKMHIWFKLGKFLGFMVNQQGIEANREKKFK